MAGIRDTLRLRLPLVVIGALVGLVPVIGSPISSFASDDSCDKVHIYISAGCADCWPYVEEIMIPTLRAGGISAEVEIHDYTVPAERTRLLEMVDSIELPRSIADSLYAFVPLQESDLVILGHVPPDLIEQVLVSANLPPRLVIWQPEMHGDPTEYRLWAWAGDVVIFDIETPFEEALTKAQASQGPLPIDLANLDQLLPAVIVTGLVDSVNPCAFAVILPGQDDLCPWETFSDGPASQCQR